MMMIIISNEKAFLKNLSRENYLEIVLHYILVHNVLLPCVTFSRKRKAVKKHETPFRP
jgi:hypothetical protein